MYDNFHIVYSIIDSIGYALVKIYAAITFFLKKKSCLSLNIYVQRKLYTSFYKTSTNAIGTHPETIE